MWWSHSVQGILFLACCHQGMKFHLKIRLTAHQVHRRARKKGLKEKAWCLPLQPWVIRESVRSTPPAIRKPSEEMMAIECQVLRSWESWRLGSHEIRTSPAKSYRGDVSSLTAMGTSSTEFEPGPDFQRCLDTAGQVDLQLPAFLPIWKKNWG